MASIFSGRIEPILVFIAIYIVLSWSVWIPFRAGYLWVAQPGYMAIAAYMSALASRDWGLPFILSLLVGVSCSTIIAFLFGIPCLRFKARGLGVPVVSIGFFEVLRVVFNNLEVFGATEGFANIPFFQHTLPVSWLLVVIVLFFMSRLMSSRLGRAIEAMNDDEEAAAALGVNVNAVKLFVWTTSGFLAGLGGVLFAHYITYLQSATFSFHLLTIIALFAVAGGMTTYWGPLVGTIVLWSIPEIFRDLAEYRGAIYASLLIIVMLFRPHGIITKSMIEKVKPAGWLKHSFSRRQKPSLRG
jgi:branched-chain amino acid transport system permease protein